LLYLDLVAPIKAGLPQVQIPAFSSTVNNVTYNFFDMASILGSGLVIVPLLSLLEDVSGGKVFCKYKFVDLDE
jgi:sodium-independent sulfate anion transporter 11